MVRARGGATALGNYLPVDWFWARVTMCDGL